MNIRKLIREEVEKVMTCEHDPQALRRNIPFEHSIQTLRDTQHESSFHLGSKAITAKDMDLYGKSLDITPVNRVQIEKKREMTEREKDYNRFFLNYKLGAGGPFVRSAVEEVVRFDGVMYANVMRHFNVKAMFEDTNGNCVIKISLKDKNIDGDRKKHEEYIPGGLASKKSLKDIAELHSVEYAALMKQFKKGVKVEMEHTTDELIAMEIAKDHLVEDPLYYDKLETIEKPEFENTMGVSAYTPPNASLLEKRMDEVLENVNRTMGTNYYVKTMYPERHEQVYVIGSGHLDEDGEMVEQGKLLNFTKEENRRNMIVGMLGGVDDGSPWREITEPINAQPYRSAIVGTSHQNA